MSLTKIGFFANLALVVITASIIVTYIFKSTENQCQMTFMMEPPKFIPVPIEGAESSLDQSTKQHTLNIKNDLNYKLFMYSEFGFPLTSNVARDLKDSMPVLFVPGNAGSYQQVRSLASTCIRRQLQSLEAYKFVFYTIDFRDQLSGVSGDLVANQISFVHQAIDQINSMHPSDTNGIILIGHSVGGFITKAVFSMPNFDSRSVPLLINLASPLTRPYLNFDIKMKQLYQNVSDYWTRHSNSIKTLSISVSGGKSDKLVPKHLSLDHQYDLSLITSSIRDVWLTTDHVCITWCRELMHKLAHLFSALMDKKQTRLISDRRQALNIIKTELLTRNIRYNGQKLSVTQKESRITKSYVTKSIEEFFSATRNQLIDETIILNQTNRNTYKDYLVVLEHIESLKETGIYGCKNIDGKNPTICNEKIDLTPMFHRLPSRKFEPKKTIIRLDRVILATLNYLVLDFSSNSREGNISNKIPESISMLQTNLEHIEDLHIPDPIEYVIDRISLLFFKKQVKRIHRDNHPLVFKTYRLKNLIHSAQFITVLIESKNCAGAHQSEKLASVYYGEYLKESYHPDKDTQSLAVKLSNSKSVVIREKSQIIQEQTLELFLDGNCDNSIEFKLDFWNLIENAIQVHLERILICSTYFAYTAIVCSMSRFEEIARDDKVASSYSKTHCIMRGSSLYMLCLISRNSHLSTFEFGYLSDEMIQFCLICFLSGGTVAVLEYVSKRIVDLATITYNIQSTISSRINQARSRNKILNSNGAAYHVDGGKKDQEDGESKNGDNNKNSLHCNNTGNKSMGHNYDWILVASALLGNILFSEALISVCMLLIITKVAVSLNAIYYRTQISRQATSNRHCCKSLISSDFSRELDFYEAAFELLIKTAAMCFLSLLSNIPAALLRINKFDMLGSNSLYATIVGQFGENFIILFSSLLLIKFVSEIVDSSTGKGTINGRATETSFIISRPLEKMPSKYLHLSTIPLIALIGEDMRRINLVLLILLIWIDTRLIKLKIKPTHTHTNTDDSATAAKPSKRNKVD